MQTEQRTETILEHRGLVAAIAYKLLGASDLLEDANQAGLIGLIDAVDRHRPELGPLTNYAGVRIRGEILDWLRSNSGRTREAMRFIKRRNNTLALLGLQLGQLPDDEQVAAEMGLTCDRYHELVGIYCYDICSVDAEKEDGSTILDRLAADSPSPEEEFDRKRVADLLWAAVDRLPIRYGKVMRLYFQHGLFMAEIGKHMGVNESRVSQIITASLNYLRADETLEPLSPTPKPALNRVQEEYRIAG